MYMPELPRNFFNFLEIVASEYGIPDFELDILRRTLDGKTANKISEELKITDNAVRKRMGSIYNRFGITGSVLGKRERLEKVLFHEYETRQNETTDKTLIGLMIENQPSKELDELPNSKNSPSQHKIVGFYGRTNELEILKNYLLGRNRLILVSGDGGIGKSSLIAKFYKFVKDNNIVGLSFQKMLWYSLRTTPSVVEQVKNIIEDISGERGDNLSDLDVEIKKLIKLLRDHQCLIVLDNVESILLKGGSGKYKDSKYDGYGDLFRKIAEEYHNSCLILTSREQPEGINYLNTKNLPVKILRLEGLKENDAYQLFKDLLSQEKEGKDILSIDNIVNDDERVKSLISYFRYSPLALKISSSTVREIYDGKIEDFIESLVCERLKEANTELPNYDSLEYLSDTDRLNDLFIGQSEETQMRNLLQEQFQRLSDIEKRIIYWLAIEYNPVSINELQSRIIPSLPIAQLSDRLKLLNSRSLIEKQGSKFTLQGVLFDFFIAEVVNRFFEEITAGDVKNIEILSSHTLKKVNVNERFLNSLRSNLFLKPLSIKVNQWWTSKKNKQFSSLGEYLRNFLGAMIEQIRGSSIDSGYQVSNILIYLIYNQISLDELDFSGLTIKELDIENTEIHNADFTDSTIENYLFPQNMDSPLSVAFSPISNERNEQKIAVGCADGSVRLWNINSNNEKLISNKKEHSNWVRTVVFSPDGKTLASGGDDYKIILWGVEDLGKLTILTDNTKEKHKNWVCSLAFHPQGDFLVSGSQDKTIKLWSTKKSSFICNIATATEIDDRFWSLAFSPDGNLLAAGSESGKLYFWDTSDIDNIQRIDRQDSQSTQNNGHQKTIFSVTFSSKNVLASAGDDGKICLWKPTKTEEDKCNCELLPVHLTLEKKSKTIRSIAFNPNGDILVAVYDDGIIDLWDVKERKLKQDSPLQAHTPCRAGEDKTLKVWKLYENLSKPKCIWSVQGISRGVWSVSFSSDGKKLVSGTDESVLLWNIEDIEKIKDKDKIADRITKLGQMSNRIWTVAFNHQENIFASGSDDGKICLWDTSSKRELSTRNNAGSNDDDSQEQVWSLHFSLDGKWLASGSNDYQVRLWSVERGKLKFSDAFDNESSVWSVAFSPDGKTLASGSDDCKVRLWNIETGKLENPQIFDNRNRVWSVAFSPDGKILASGNDNGSIFLWDIETGKSTALKNYHQTRVWCVDFSPDGKWLASGSDDGNVVLWSGKYYEEPEQLYNHDDWVCSVVFSRDGKYIASGSKDSTIKIYDVNEKKLIGLPLQRPRPLEGTNITNIQGINETEIENLISLGARDDLRSPDR
jgi:WD40 repeat protein